MDIGLFMEGDHRLRPAISFGLSCAYPFEDNVDFTQNSITLSEPQKQHIRFIFSVKQCEFIL